MVKKVFSIFFLIFLVSFKGWAEEKKYDWFTYSLNLQTWDTQIVDGQNYSQVRRAENKFTFRLNPDWTTVVMLDPAKVQVGGKDALWLQDAFVQWKINKNWQWQIGQFKIPISEEGLRPSPHLDTIERSQFNLGGNKFSDLRELGTMMVYQDRHILAQAGVFSGDPTNQSVGTSLREGAARLIYSPDGHFNFGGAVTRGSRHNVDQPLTNLELSNKSGLEFWWDNKPWLVEAEYVSGRLDVPTVSSGVITAITPTYRQGWYAKVRYDINSKLQAVLKEDAVFPNVNLPANGERDITAGFNYWFQRKPQEVELQLNYVNRRSFSAAAVPSIYRANLEFFF